MKIWLARIGWLLGVPLLVALGLLFLHGTDGGLEPTAPPAEMTPPQAPKVREVRLQLRSADGGAPRGAVVLAVEPELAQGEVGEDGNVLLRLSRDGALRILAWAPDHRLTEVGPWSEPPAEPVILERIEQPEFAPIEPELRVERAFLVVDARGEALPFALVCQRSAAAPESPPWVGFADATGALRLRGPAGETLVSAYSPGHAAEAGWLVAEQRVAADAADPVQIVASCGDLVVRGLAAGEAAELRRAGSVLDRAVANAAGQVRWSALPLGAWEVGIETGETMAVVVTAPGIELLWQ